MVKMSDNFFQSIGMFPMTKTFWKKSVFEKENDKTKRTEFPGANDLPLRKPKTLDP